MNDLWIPSDDLFDILPDNWLQEGWLTPVPIMGTWAIEDGKATDSTPLKENPLGDGRYAIVRLSKEGDDE